MSRDAASQQGVRVQVCHLHKSFSGHPVLQDVNLDVSPGEIFVIMGPSGSGKTVLLKHVIGLEKPDEGEILINGESIESPEVMERYRLAMVFQSGALLNSLTVGENVGLYLTEHRSKPEPEIARIVTEKLELVGLKGLESRSVSELSGGMKKRVAIARALVIEPQLLLYDEPTSELDPLIAVTVAEEIANLNRRSHVTSIIVTHNRDLAFGIAERMALISEGRIIVAGTPGEVRASRNPDVQRFLTVDFKQPLTTP